MDKVIVHIPLGDMMHCDDPARSQSIYQRCLMNPQWWESRGNLMRRYTMPALEAARGIDVEVWATIRPETIRYAGPVLEQIGRMEGRVFPFALNEALLAYGRDAIVAHLDSDDIYGPHALRLMADACTQEGSVAMLRDGYYLDVNHGTMAEVSVPGGPPFFAKFWTRQALSNRESLEKYAAQWHKPYHHQMRTCERVSIIPGRHYIQTIHGDNTSSAWNNPHTRNKITRMIESPEEAALIYARFIGGQ